MARTPSLMVSLGTPAGNFELPDTISGKTLSLNEVSGEKGTLVMFICNHCPFVKHVAPQISQLATDYRSKGIGFVAISSNDAEAYPEDAPDRMKAFAIAHRFSFPYLYDESQSAARSYQAVCTPDFFLFNSSKQLVYRGQLDGSRPGNDVPVTGTDLRHALDALLAGRLIPAEQRPSLGCSIKWKTI